MIKFVIAAVWICAVTVGSIFFAFSAPKSTGGEEPKAAPYFGGLDYVKTDVLSVPLIKQNSVQGYFLARFVYTVDPGRMGAMSVPLENILIDQAFSYIYDSPLVDFTRTDRLDLDAFRNELRDSINARVGEKLIHEVLIEQVDYLSKQEIRDNSARRRSGQSAVSHAPEPKPAGH